MKELFFKFKKNKYDKYEYNLNKSLKWNEQVGMRYLQKNLTYE